ncbi:hypothetical protein [Granulicella arctica]|uniref:hypothetical protein n=1 Tax=Granulicella arctica TaxID=940613 RepID=UPI0021DFD03F|nr:hypothetical protein [Granulicella arctica]
MPFLRNTSLLFLFLGLMLFEAPQVQGQSRITADKAAGLDAFGGFTGLDNDYYGPDKNYGVTLGGDYTHYIKRFRGLIVPAFEVRGTVTPGGTVGERTLEGGLKLGTTFRRLQPYGDFMIGNGVITFPLPAVVEPGVTYRTRDSSFLYIYGGGLTYDLGPRLSLLVDYQRQYWDLGKSGRTTPDRFYPQAVTLGVLYRIPFKAYKTR